MATRIIKVEDDVVSSKNKRSLPQHNINENSEINQAEDKKFIQGSRVSGKSWKVDKQAYKKSLNLKGTKMGFQERRQQQEQQRLLKQKLQLLKDEKENEKKAKIELIKKRAAEKEEKERYERLAIKYNKKKVERLRRKEKRSKLLSDGRKNK